MRSGLASLLGSSSDVVVLNRLTKHLRRVEVGNGQVLLR